MLAATQAGQTPSFSAATLRGRMAQWLFFCTAAAALVIAALFVWVLWLVASGASGAPVDRWSGYLNTAGDAFGLASSAAVCAGLVWLHRAVANRSVLLEDQAPASPWMAVVWWVVPVAFLFMPYRVVRDLYDQTAGKTQSLGDRLVPVWWASWLLSWVLFAVTWIVTPNVNSVPGAYAVAGLGLAYSLVVATTALLAALIVRSVAQGQARMAAEGSGG